MSTNHWQYLLGGLFALAFLLAILGLVMSWGNSTALATTAAIMTGALVVVSRLSEITEFSIGLKGVRATVSKLKDEIDETTFLIRHSLPRWERAHLQNLARNERFDYDKVRFPRFEQELRHLRDCDLVAPKKSGFRVSELPARGDLHEYFKLSPEGEKFLELWKQIESKK